MFLVADSVRLTPFESDDALEPGAKRREVVRRPGLLPDLLRSRGDPGEFFHQVLRQLDRPVIAATDLANVDGRRGLRILDKVGALNRGKTLADLRVRGPFVSQ